MQDLNLELAWGETICIQCKEQVASVKDRCSTCYQKAYRKHNPKPSTDYDPEAMKHFFKLAKICLKHLISTANEIKNLK